jgi:putative ABC transport system permease protein
MQRLRASGLVPDERAAARRAGWIAALLARLLPRRIARELFEPARCDLDMARARRNATSRDDSRPPSEAAHAGALLLLWLDCLRLALANPREAFRRSGRDRLATKYDVSHPNEEKERVAVLLYHLRHALRRLIGEPAFTVAAILTLGIGVGANIAVFTVAEAVLLRPLPYPAANELVILNHRDTRTGITKEFIAMGDYVDIVDRQKVFSAVGAFGSQGMTVNGLGEPFQVEVLAATGGLFDALGVKPLLGRAITADDSRTGAAPVMLLGHKLWQERFGGDRNVVGRSLQIGQTTYSIVGVAPRDFRFHSLTAPDAIVSMRMPVTAPTGRTNGWTFMVARLKPGTTLARAEGELNAISRQLETEYPQANQGSQYFLIPLRDALLGESKTALFLLLGAVAVVLLIACTNVANLLLARSLARQGEMALRKALGAGQGRLAVQLVAESLVLSVAAGGVGLLMALWGSSALVRMIPESVRVPGLADVHINVSVLAFALLVTIATTIVFGMVSLATVRFVDARAVLVAGGKASMSTGARRATSWLVGAEVAFAVVLLLGAGLILKTFAGLLSVNPGFSYDRVMTVALALPGERYRESAAREGFYRRAFAALRSVPGVAAVGTAAVTPLTGNNWTIGLRRTDKPLPTNERPPEVGWQVASGGYFQALQIPLRSGRFFTDADGPTGMLSVIVSDELAKTYFPGESALGKRVAIGDSTAEIVGIVGSIRRAGLRDAPRADMYLPFERQPSTGTTLFVRTSGDPEFLLASMLRAIKDIEPGVVVRETRSLSDVASESVRATRLLLSLLGFFAVTALVLAVVGIYGVMSYVVRQRTREIGTRIALGARSGSIVWLVIRQGARISIAGAAVGLAVGIGAGRVLDSVLFGITAHDPVVLLCAPAVLVLATLVACWIPARRAASVDPARTLSAQ